MNTFPSPRLSLQSHAERLRSGVECIDLRRNTRWNLLPFPSSLLALGSLEVTFALSLELTLTLPLPPPLTLANSNLSRHQHPRARPPTDATHLRTPFITISTSRIRRHRTPSTSEPPSSMTSRHPCRRNNHSNNRTYRRHLPSLGRMQKFSRLHPLM